MKIHQNYTSGLFFAVVAATTSVTDGEFAQITGDFGDATSLQIGASCISGSSFPFTMWTIMATNGVEVHSDPANLVSVSINSGKLSFEFNETVASSATSGGIRIGMPAGQLESVTVESASNAQILDGFEKVTEISVSGASTLAATFTSSAAGSLELRVDGASTTNIQSNIILMGGSINGASTANVQAPSYDDINVNGASTLRVDGTIGGGSVNGASTVTATGDIKSSISANGASTINALGNCDVVSLNGASSCNTGTQTVSVDTSQKGETMTGTGTCSGWGFSWTSGSSVSYFNKGGLVITAAATAVFLAM